MKTIIKSTNFFEYGEHLFNGGLNLPAENNRFNNFDFIVD